MKDQKIRAVIWDIGGVLVRTVDHEPRARLAERLGVSIEELASLVFDSPKGQQAQLGLISTRELWEYVGQVLKLSPPEIVSVEREFFAGDVLDTGLVAYIRSLRPRYLTGIVSNAWSDVREVIDKRWQIADAFDYIVISAEVKLTKPNPRIFRLALQGLGVGAAEAVFIDDFLQNVEGALSLGMQAIHFTSPEQTLSELESLLDGRQPFAPPQDLQDQ